MIGKGIRGGICHANHRFAEANKKYLKDYDENNELSYQGRLTKRLKLLMKN